MTEPRETASRGHGRTWLLWLLGPIMAIALGVVVYDTLPLLYPKALMLAPMDPACDLRAGPCTARFASGGIVRFGIAPRDIPVLKPLRPMAERSRCCRMPRSL